MATGWASLPSGPGPSVQTAERAVYTVAEVATMLGRSEWTVRRWIRTGVLPSPSTKTPSMFVPKAAFHRWLNGGVSG